VNGVARVYLVRHAEAERQAASDAARRLTPAGRARFEAHARTLALRPTRIVTGPFARARETAELLAAATGAPIEEDAALASGVSTGRALLAIARRAGDGAALVGHNPELAEAVALAAGRGVAVPPGTVAVVDVDAAGERLVSLLAPG
jgi:phosphohistidine phosphatase